MNTDNNQPENLGHIFLNSFSLFKKTCFHVAPLTVFLSVIVFSPSLFIYNPEKPLLLVGYFIFSVFTFASVIHYVAHIHRGDHVYLTQSMLTALKKLPIIILATILMILLTLLAYCFLIIPGIIATVWFSMCLPLILLDNAGPFSVLRKSYELTTDDWLRTAVIVFLPSIISGLLGAVVTEIFIRYRFSFVYYEILLGIFIFFASLIYLPWIAALLVSQFEDLKKRKILRDLQAQSLSLAEEQKSML